MHSGICLGGNRADKNQPADTLFLVNLPCRVHVSNLISNSPGFVATVWAEIVSYAFLGAHVIIFNY
jgi:hypothetical protein